MCASLCFWTIRLHTSCFIIEVDNIITNVESLGRKRFFAHSYNTSILVNLLEFRGSGFEINQIMGSLTEHIVRVWKTIVTSRNQWTQTLINPHKHCHPFSHYLLHCSLHFNSSGGGEIPSNIERKWPRV